MVRLVPGLRLRLSHQMPLTEAFNVIFIDENGEGPVGGG